MAAQKEILYHEENQGEEGVPKAASRYRRIDIIWDCDVVRIVRDKGVCYPDDTHFTDKLCSPINRNKPASTLVGVKPKIFINGGLTKSMMPPECKNADHRCS